MRLVEKIARMSTNYSWICSDCFVTGINSNDPLAPKYIPTLLSLRVLSEGNLVKYFTGLPKFLVLKVIYNFVSKEIPVFDQYLLTLMKLQFNVSDKDLAYRFGISQACVSRYVSKWLDVLSSKLSFLSYSLA